MLQNFYFLRDELDKLVKEERRGLKEIRDEMTRLREEKEMIRRQGRDVQEFRREVCIGIFFCVYFCLCIGHWKFFKILTKFCITVYIFFRWTEV